MALSATELLRLRDLTGGRTNTNDLDHLTDEELQAEFSLASAGWAEAVVLVLRRRLAMASKYVNKAMDLNSDSMSQYVEHLRDLLEDAEAQADMTPGNLSVKLLRHSLNTRDDDA